MIQKEATVKKSILFFLTVASSLLISASFPPLNLGACAWFGLAPFLFALRQRGFLASSILGYLFGSLVSISAFSWTMKIEVVYLSDFLIFLVVFSLYFLTFGFCYRLISRNLESWTIIGAPVLWVTLEYIRSNLFFLSWPWNLLGHSQYNYLSFIQIADATGVYGPSFLIVFVNQFLSEAPDFLKVQKASQSDGPKSFPCGKKLLVHSFAAISVVAVALSYGWYRLAQRDGNKHLRVALVQGNVLAWDNMSFSQQKDHMLTYVGLTRNAARNKPDLIVWPASSLPAEISNRYVRWTVLLLAQEIKSYIVVGGSGHQKDKPKKPGYLPYSNSEFLISPEGGIDGQYNKILLTPFNEYVPLRSFIRWPQWITTAKEDFIPGTEYVLFHILGTSFGTPICWENMFADHFRRFVAKGAQFMVIVTNEGFFGNSSSVGQYQTLAMNVFRAVENRVAIARASTTGVSCFINPNGAIVDRVKDGNGRDLFVSGILVRDIPLAEKKAFYTCYGDVFAYIVIGITAFIIVIAAIRSKKFQSY
jgi:apolipoprotein N-acyltransferase